MVRRVYQLDHVRGHEYGALRDDRVARRVRVLAIFLSRRQAPVLLVAHESDDAAGRIPAAVLPALYGAGPHRYAYCRGIGSHGLQRTSGCMDSRGFISGVP